MMGVFTSTFFIAATGASGDWQASWIWKQRDRYDGYNDTIEARRSFELGACASASLRITADTYYRLFVNGQWVNDGPGRSWPDHFQFDVIDVAPYLKTGENEIRVIAKFFGIGTFHQIPVEAGLLAQLDALDAQGNVLATIATDGSWDVRDAAGWAKWAPKRSVQMDLYEIYDARVENTGDFVPAVVRYATFDGPWRDLQQRDCPLLTRKPFPTNAFVHAKVVQPPPWDSYVFPASELARDGITFANNQCMNTGVYATVLELGKAATVKFDADGNRVIVDGAEGPNGRFKLEAGRHFVLIALSEYFGHWRTDTVLHIEARAPYTLHNPLDDAAESPWCFARLDGGDFEAADYKWAMMSDEEKAAARTRIDQSLADAVANAGTQEGFRAKFGDSARTLDAGQITPDVNNMFQTRRPVETEQARVDNPQDMTGDMEGETVIHPAKEGDVELVYDLGEQNVGFWQFEVDAEPGLILDLAGVEYITPQGRVQHTGRYRNTMRYICKDGDNRFTSLVRRSGRYLFLTFRGLTKPATLRGLRLIESTYPVQPIGRFEASDPRLTRIWEISARTLKLCMEDSFTDCPLYEQTLWVGDARNEAIFGYTAFGAADLARRCARITAYSLEQHPLALCQVPTTWETLLPAWSFLWGIMVWDYYFYSGDQNFLEWAYPYVIKNLKGAEQFSDARGLFSGPFWNMFDWTDIDDGHATVTHNSMFVVGALDAAIKCGETLGDKEHLDWLRGYRERLVKAVNGLWDNQRGWYPDSIHNDGAISPKSCIHTGFLSLLYDVVPPEHHDEVLAKVLNSPDTLTPLGSPFAAMYLFEALEKEGQAEEIVQRIYQFYQPMLDLNATTVWESFAEGNIGRDQFPTRSHCHAWSSAPIHFLNRIVLGIVPESAGGTSITISPHLCDLDWAKGASASARGPVQASWKRDGDTVTIDAEVPEGVSVRYEPNDSLKGLKVVFNGNQL